MTDHPTPGSPLSADDVGLLKRGDRLKVLKSDMFLSSRGFREGSFVTFRSSDDGKYIDLEDMSCPQGTLAYRFAFVERPTDRRAEADTPPSAGLDAGLETVAWRWETPVPHVGDGTRWGWSFASHWSTPPSSLNAEPLVTRQSAAAALEAAAEREEELRARVDYLRTSRDGHAAASHEQFQRATRAEAQVAALRESLEKIKKVTATKTVGAAFLLSEIRLHADQAPTTPATVVVPDRFYIDCEFDGHNGSLLSIAIVREDGDSIHIRADVEPMDLWVRKNVLPIMDDHRAPKSVKVYHDEVGSVIRSFIGESVAPVIVADSPVDIGRFCRALSTGPDGQWAPADYPLMTFEVHNVDCYPTQLEGAVQHNAWWDAMALRAALAARPAATPGGEREDSAFKIASDLHAAYEQLIYGLPKYLEAENLTDEENMIREAYITLDVTAHRLAALSRPAPVAGEVVPRVQCPDCGQRCASGSVHNCPSHGPVTVPGATKPTDIVGQLRHFDREGRDPVIDAMCQEAADEIERLAARIEYISERKVSAFPLCGGPIEQVTGLTVTDALDDPEQALSILRNLTTSRVLCVWADGTYRVTGILDLPIARAEEGTLVGVIPLAEIGEVATPARGGEVFWRVRNGESERGLFYDLDVARENAGDGDTIEALVPDPALSAKGGS